MAVTFLTNEDRTELESKTAEKVSFAEAQELTDEQKAQARANIGAVSEEEFNENLGIRENLVDTETLVSKIEGSTGTDYTSSNIFTWDSANNIIMTNVALANNGRRLLAGQPVLVDEGDVITVSADFMFANAVEDCVVILGIENQYKTFTLTSEIGVWQRFYNTITVNNESARESGVRILTQNYNAANTLYIRNIQLNYGDEVVEYCPYGETSSKISEHEVRISALESGQQIVGSNIGEKCAEFAKLLNDTDKVESFLFFTDPHLAEGDAYESQMRSYLNTIKTYYDATPSSFVLCGGDWLGNSDTQAEACFKLGYIDAQMRSRFDRYYHVIGNHDTNYQGVIEEGADAYSGTLTNETIRNLMLRGEEKLYYSFDGVNTKFYVLDTGSDFITDMTDYRWEQISWLVDRLKTDDAENSAIVMHITHTGSVGAYVISTFASNIMSVLNAYNDRQSITLNGVSYNFSDQNGSVRFVLGGHKHYDYVDESYGIPIILTTNTRSGDTPTFDLCLIDYDKNVVNMIRIGLGENRKIEIGNSIYAVGNTYEFLPRTNHNGGTDITYYNSNFRAIIVSTLSESGSKVYGCASGTTSDTEHYPMGIPTGKSKIAVNCPGLQVAVIEIGSSGSQNSTSGWKDTGYSHAFSGSSPYFLLKFRQLNDAGSEVAFDMDYDASNIYWYFE